MSLARKSRLLVTGGLVPAALMAAPITPARAASDTPASVHMLTAEEQAAVVGSLTKTAQAVDIVGDRDHTSVYSGVRVDPQNHVVNLYVTDTAKAEQILDQARSEHRDGDFSTVRVSKSLYTHKELQSARDRLLAQENGMSRRIVSIGVPSDGSGLLVGVEPSEADKTAGTLRAEASADLAPIAGVPVAVSSQHMPVLTSRAEEEAPFRAGGMIRVDTGTGYAQCTSGIPVRRNSDNSYGMVTAQHCAGNGDVVYNGALSKEGTVTSNALYSDAAMYSVTGNVAKHYSQGSDSDEIRSFSGVARAVEGTSVCNSGYVSGTKCGIQVLVREATYHAQLLDGTIATFAGAYGRAPAGYPAVRRGDSGGPLYLPLDDGTSQLQGVVSAGMDPVGADGFNLIIWAHASVALTEVNARLSNS